MTIPHHLRTLGTLLICTIVLSRVSIAAAEKEPTLSEGARLNRLAENYYERLLELFPVKATFNGDYRYNHLFADDISEEQRQRQRELYERCLRELATFDRSKLSVEDQLTLGVMQFELESRLDDVSFDGHLIPVSQLFTPPVLLPLLGSGSSIQPFRNEKDYRDFLQRLHGFTLWVDTAIENLRLGLEKKVVLPKVVVQKTLPQLDAVVEREPEENIFYKPIQKFPETVSSQARADLKQAYTEAIQTTVRPTYRKLRDFLKDEYLPHARDTVGLSDLPNGRAWYRHLVKEMTTTEMSPDEIFALGQREVERIDREMNALREADKFDGTLADYVKSLRAREPGYASKDDLTVAYNDLRAGIERKLPDLFGVLAKAPYEIRPIEDFREASAPAQYTPAPPDGSRPGIFYYNGGGLKSAPVQISESLFLHEAVPGHHFQNSISRERNDLPRVRRFTMFGAYTEGWGLYAESLGPQLGLYRTSYQRMDALSGEMWRARRLVVDVGLHWKSWSRDRAVKYMQENPVQILPPELEVDRYIAMPAQALCYKIGELKIKELRSRAQQRLGDRFELRKFHDLVLKHGAMPLTVLEKQADDACAAGEL